MYILERVAVTLDSRTQISCCVSINPQALWDEAKELNGDKPWQEFSIHDNGCGFALAKGDEWGGLYYYVHYVEEI